MLAGGLLHALLSLGMSGLQGAAHFLFQVGDGAQGDRHLKHGFADFLDAAFAHVGTAAEIAQSRTQAWADAVAAEFFGDRGMGNLATAGAGAAVPLVFGDYGSDFGKFGVLVPGGLGVVWSGFFGQRRLAVGAGDRHDDNGMLDALGRQANAGVAVMSGLSPGFAAGRFFVDRLGGVRRIGGRRYRGVGCIPPGAFPKLAALGL